MSDLLPAYQFMSAMNEEAFAALKADIAFRGVIVPVLLDGEGRVLDGHHRVRACEELGITDYPRFIVSDLDEADKETFVKAINSLRRHESPEAVKAFILEMRAKGRSLRQIAELAQVSLNTVQRRLDNSTVLNSTVELPETVVGKDGKVRSASRPKSIYATSAKETEITLDLLSRIDDEQIAELPATATVTTVRKELRKQDRAEVAAMREPLCPPENAPTVLPGEWWRLGNHLLFCGDSGSAEFRSKCPSSIPFAFADPPYNVDKAGWDTGFVWAHDYIADVADVVAVTPGTRGLVDFLRTCQMPYRWIFTAWIKNGMTVGGMGFQNALHALLFGHTSIHRNEQDFMELVISTGTTADTMHPTRKPLRFVARLMQIYSDEGDSVLDPFLGSGTTLWAAEELGRACIGAELSPLYCAEIVGRWQAMTGRMAEKEA